MTTAARVESYVAASLAAARAAGYHVAGTEIAVDGRKVQVRLIYGDAPPPQGFAGKEWT